ncbi:MAG: hypothetical protein GX153_11250, partial [Clostridiaceae bacterium]|nr:hypothetical protein [Clostridiaceae bacterium]
RTITVLVVARLDAAVLSAPILQGTNWNIGRQDSSGPLGVSLGTQRLEAATSTEGLDGKWTVFSAVISRSKLVFHIDKQEYALTLGTAPSVSTGSISLNTSGVDIAEVLVYNRDLSSSGDLESLKTWLFQKYKPEITPWSIRQLYPISGAIEQGGSYSLPATVSARLVDGTKMNVPVDWSPSAADTSAAGTQTYVATAREDATKTTILTLQVIGIESIPVLTETRYQHPGEVFTLPTEVPALFEDGIIRQTEVVWDSPSVDLSTIGVFTIHGHSALDNSISAEYTVTIENNPVTGITLNPASIQMQPGESRTIVATVLPADASDPSIAWSSSNEAVVRVVNGTVTGMALGSAQITVTSVANPSVTATCLVTVGERAELSDVSGRQGYYSWMWMQTTSLNMSFDPQTYTYSATMGAAYDYYQINIDLPWRTSFTYLERPSGFEFGEYEYFGAGQPITIRIRVSAPGKIPTDYTFIIRRP